VIPGKIVRFLEQYANVGFAGTRDADLVPYGHRVSGWQVSGDARTMAVFVPDNFTVKLIESLQQNGELAVVVEEFPSHETYQFKGRYLRHRAVAGGELEVVDRIRSRFVRSLRPLFAHAPESIFSAFVQEPSLSVEFEVQEVYLQTPGPGAGTRLIPPAGQ
jgi:hypothetical protein